MVGRATVASELTGWVGTAVLSVSNTEVGIFRLVLDTINGLDRVGDVGEVDKGTVPSKTIIENT